MPSVDMSPRGYLGLSSACVAFLLAHRTRPIYFANAPEVNFANANARVVLTAIGLDAGEYLCGALDAAEVEGAIAECEAARACTATGVFTRSAMLRDPYVSSRVHVAGTGDARACERLDDLLHVLRWAYDHGAGVAWG